MLYRIAVGAISVAVALVLSAAPAEAKPKRAPISCPRPVAGAPYVCH